MQARSVFTVPTESSRKKAIGSFVGASKLTIGAINSILPLFKPIAQPNPGDWLAENNETGQTFEDFVKNKKTSSQIKTVRIQPLEENIDEELLRVLQAFTQAYFNPVRVVICLPINISELGAESRVNTKSETFQYQAASVLEKLETLFSENECCTMGVTMTDIYSREDRNFVYGLASHQARVGVFSFARLCDGFLDQARLTWRSSMVITHEIGHMFGLKHCIYFSCMMNGATHLEEASKPFYLCPVCLRKLQHAIGFSFAERYKNLGAVCKELGNEFLEASKWYNQTHKSVMQSYGNNYQKYVEEEKNSKTLKNPISTSAKTIKTVKTSSSSLNKNGQGSIQVSKPKTNSTNLVSIPVAKNNIKSQLDLYKGL